MKRFILFTFSILLTFSFAIAQDGINYQGAATDANGDELTNQNITIRASVLSTSTIVPKLEWEETHSATTDQFGLFNVVIGQGTNTTNGALANFDDMNWGSSNHFLKIEMDATGGTNYTMIGTTQMMSVPYALYAKSAGTASGTVANGTTTGEMLYWDGTNWLALTPPNYNNMFLTYNINSHAPEWVTSTANVVVIPVASFSVSADTIYQGGSINFTDNSTQYPIAWDWDFGDGNTSTQQHPTHTFYSSGTYVVTLIVTNNSWGGPDDTTTHTILVVDNPVAQVGHYRDGGVVFWVDPNNSAQGLVCDVSDVANGAQWGCQGTSISGADGNGIGTGAQNTIDIVNGCSTGNIAAKQCADNASQGYHDWFLPSKDELNEIFVNQSVIDSVAQVVGGSVFPSSTWYWSSSEHSSTHARSQMGLGGQTQHQKTSSANARAIRAF